MQIRAQNQANPGRRTSLPDLSAKGAVLDAFEKNFRDWDRDDNGQISWSEMRRNVADPRINGKDAVALATLYGLVEQDAVYRGLERKSPVTPHRMYDLYYDYTDDETDRPLADDLFQKYRAKLKNAADELFPHVLPNAHMGQQGTAPSCGFLAATFSQVVKDPRLVAEAVKETEDGFEVRFPGVEKPVRVSRLTDTEKALFATAESNGSWLTVLEKAWGTHLSKGHPLRAFEESTYPEEAIAAWTNGPATTARIPKNPSGFKSGELPHFLRTTARELAADHTVVVWTRFTDLTEDSLVPGHAYTLTGIDHEAGLVSLRNPWGKREPVDEDGKALDGRDDGLFEFSLGDFHKNFARVARQTG